MAAIKVPIVSEFNSTGIVDAERSLAKFGVKSSGDLKKAAAGFGILAGAGAAAFSSLDAGYDAIVTGTGATGDALQGLKDDANAVAREVPNSFGDVGAAIAEVNTRLGLTGPELQESTKRFLDLSRVTGIDVTTAIADVTRVFGDWSIATEDQSLAMDQLYAASQQTGIGVDRLSQLVVQFGAPMRQLGFEFEEAIALFGKFEKEGVNVEAIMSGLRMGLGRMAKAGEEPIETFQRLVDEIAAAGSTGEANALALEAFGQRAGPDMAAAIREGRFELDDLVAALGDAGGALATAAEETLSPIDRFKQLGNQIMVTAAPALENLAEILEVVIGAFTALPEGLQTAVVGVGALALVTASANSLLKAFGLNVAASGVSAAGAARTFGALAAAVVVYKAAIEGGNSSMDDALLIAKDWRGSAESLREALEDLGYHTVDIDMAVKAYTSSGGKLLGVIGDLENAEKSLSVPLAVNKRATEELTGAQGELEAPLAANKRAIEGLSGELVDVEADLRDAAEASRDLQRAQEAQTDATLSAISSDYAYRSALEGTEQALRNVWFVSQDATKTQEDLDDAVHQAEGALLAQADAAVRQASDMAASAGQTFTAKQRTETFRGELSRLRDQVGADSDLGRRLQQHIDKLNAIPSTKTTHISTVYTESGSRSRRGGHTESHVGSRFEAGETKFVVPGQVFTPDVPGRLSSMEESGRMLSGSGLDRPLPPMISLNFEGAVFYGVPDRQFVETVAEEISRMVGGTL